MITITEEEFNSYIQERFREVPEKPGIFAGTRGTIITNRKYGRTNVVSDIIREIKPTPFGEGYLYINHVTSVHRLVAQAWIPNPDNLPEVNHKDEDKHNNCIENLEWCTHKYNMNYGTAIQRMKDTLSDGRMSEANRKYCAEHPGCRAGENNGMFNKTQSPEAKKKISIANSGENNGMYGKHPSEEMKEKNRQSQKARWADPEYRKAHSGANHHNRNAHPSEETKEKNRLAHSNKKLAIGLDGKRHCYTLEEIETLHLVRVYQAYGPDGKRHYYTLEQIKELGLQLVNP